MASTNASQNVSLGETFSGAADRSVAHIIGGHTYWRGRRCATTNTAGYADGCIRAQIDAQYDGVDFLREPNIGTLTMYFSWEAIDFGRRNRRITT